MEGDVVSEGWAHLTHHATSFFFNPHAASKQLLADFCLVVCLKQCGNT